MSLLLTYRFLGTTSSWAGLAGRSPKTSGNGILISPASLSLSCNLHGKPLSSPNRSYLNCSSGGLLLKEFPFMMPLSVITNTSEFLVPVPTYIPRDTRGAMPFLLPSWFALGRYKMCSPYLTNGVLQLLPYILSYAVFPSVPTLNLVSKNAAWRASHTRHGCVGSISNPNRSCKSERIARTCLFNSRTPTSMKPLAWWSSTGTSVRCTSTSLRSSLTFCFKATIAGSPSDFRRTCLNPASFTTPFNHATAKGSVPFAGKVFAQYLFVRWHFTSKHGNARSSSPSFI